MAAAAAALLRGFREENVDSFQLQSLDEALLTLFLLVSFFAGNFLSSRSWTEESSSALLAAAVATLLPGFREQENVGFWHKSSLSSSDEEKQLAADETLGLKGGFKDMMKK